jgi:hypothetical protein
MLSPLPSSATGSVLGRASHDLVKPMKSQDGACGARPRGDQGLDGILAFAKDCNSNFCE